VTIKGLLAIFSYGFKISEDNFKKANIDLYTLSGYDPLIDTAVKSNYINASEAETLKSWRKDPSNWKP
jgi:orotate phosphoribosyltransferase